MPLEGRAGEMARSLSAALRRLDFEEDEVAAVARAHQLAMEPRVARLGDDHHPAFLHPGRTALILLHDVGKVDVTVLVLAALHESQDAELRLPPPVVEAALGTAAVTAISAIPRPGEERLVESLVTLGPGSALAALAERLDHLRHLHLREDTIDSWADTHAEVLGAWLPFAQRVHAQLAKRYAHWAKTFVKRI